VKRKHLGGFLAAALAVTALAAAPTGADAVSLQSSKSSTTQTSRTDARANARATAQRLIAERAAALKISSGERFSAKKVVSGGAGVQYAPYTRTYRGLPVRGGDFVVMTDSKGQILGTSVAQTRPTGDLSLTPAISARRARQVARMTIDRPDRVQAPAKVVYALSGKPVLAWSVRVSGAHADGDHEVKDVFVDARTGTVLGEDVLLHFADGTGTGFFNGPSPLTIRTTQNSASSFSMTDPDIPGLDCRTDSTNTVFTGGDNAWGNGQALNVETGCVDSLFALQTEDRMIANWLGGNGFDTQGNGWRIRVGKDEINAFYCPPGLNEPGYCDGTQQVRIGHNQANTKWLSTMDVVGHEYGHGIDQNTPGGHSGGQTSEFVADVFGALTEAYANQSTTYDEPDYLVGEEVDLVGQGPIRNMYNPSAAGDPNCYSSSIPNTEVHSAAGPGNHWFYLLAEGTNPVGKPASTTCNGSSNLVGIGIQKAGKIFYNAMLMKTSSSNYLKYRTWTLTAAKNLYGTSTCSEFNAVKAAWNAVSVPAQTGDPTCTPSSGTVTVANPGNKSGTVGTAISSFTVTASGGTTPYTWSATGLPAGISIGSSTGTVSGTPTTAGTYNVTVTARDAVNVTGSTSFTFTISGGGGGCTAGQKIGNPGFETGTAAPWTASAGVIDNSTSQPARSGSWKAWLDGYGSTHTDTLTQSVTIPAGCTSATLSFYLHIDSAETTTSIAYDKLTVKLGTTTLATYSNLNKASGYSLKSFNVSSFAGQTVTLSFTGVEDSSLQTSFVIDDTALNVS